MKYFKDETNNLFGLAKDGSQDDSIQDNFIAITPEEANTILLSKVEPLTTEQIRARMTPLTALQIRKVLNQFNLRSQVETIINDRTDQALKDAWQYATEYKRDDDLLNQMIAYIGLTQDQVDQMFTVGATL